MQDFIQKLWEHVYTQDHTNTLHNNKKLIKFMYTNGRVSNIILYSSMITHRDAISIPSTDNAHVAKLLPNQFVKQIFL